MVNWKPNVLKENEITRRVCVCQVSGANIPYDVRVKKKKSTEEMRRKYRKFHMNLHMREST